ncbi:MAG: hypothetical protein CMJ18_12165 [Phycisphaeraceae bacterium]|nr:hypothetical protein [Phycisphaeraceae bacterium]
MNDQARNIAVGLTAILAAVGLAMISLLLGYVPQFLESGYEVRVELNHAGGLTSGSRVKLSGIDVGVVRSVGLLEQPRRGVEVVAFVEPQIDLPSAVKVGVEAPIIGGSPTLTFDIEHLDPEQSRQLLPTDGSAVVTGRVPSLASQFAEELRAALDEPFTQFEKFSRQWTEVGRSLETLVEPRATEQVDAGEVPANLATVLARADRRLADLEKTIQGLNRWVHDDQLHQDVRKTAANAVELTDGAIELTDEVRKSATALTDRVRASMDRLDEVSVGASEDLDRLVNRYVAVADDLSGAIRSLRGVLDAARDGDGTMGRILNDPSLYNNVNDVVERLNEALKEAQLLIEKWKKEGLPIQF